ncbi:hypothetical protein [Moraxella catarrhalis]|nr:hypothetical protein [Moraxella catarrhalis]
MENRAMADCRNSPPPLRQTELVASETLPLCTQRGKVITFLTKLR